MVRAPFPPPVSLLPLAREPRVLMRLWAAQWLALQWLALWQWIRSRGKVVLGKGRQATAPAAPLACWPGSIGWLNWRSSRAPKRNCKPSLRRPWPAAPAA